MRDIPECLNRRYKALDELIRDLSSAMGSPTTSEHPNCENNIGIKLMCDFWNILKDDPDCDLTEEVQQRMCVQSRQSSGVFGHQRVDCFMANKELDKCNEDRRQDAMRRIKHICCNQEPRSNAKRHICGKAMSGTPSVASDKMPLSKVLCNLKEAASFDKKCNVRVGELMAAQKELIQQIQTLEQRENEGVKLLKQADCMWSCMEDTYKKKVAESNERQKELLKELKEVEASATKWRKNKKDLEFQLTNITKIEEEIGEKTNQKKNDMKVMDMEIEDFKKRIESNENDTEIAKKSLKTKRDASDSRMGNIAAEMTKAQKKVTEEQKVKADKERDGSKYVKEAREDLQHMCRVLLQKKLENEDLKAEKEALLDEISLLRTTFDTCKEKCKIKEINMAEEIKRLDGEIADHKTKCIKCHECTDTVDVIKYCTDCPRCLKERDCLYENGHCSPDHSMDCVCMSMKQKFLDNVFDNMYTVLERQSKTSPGKAVADAVLNCLKRSRNGKLNQETRRILQDFILTTVKKNLNLTIVGGAVKTRCEMDPETYKQLMLCLKDVTVSKPVKEDKATGSKKEPCHRWGGPSECNCPKGPKACICTKKAPPPPHDPAPCGPPDPEDMVDVIMCPHKENTPCGPDCGMQGVTPKAAEIDVAAWRPDPCQAQTCPFSKNMRAAQCVLGPEALAATPKTHPTPPIIPILPNAELMGTCSCGDNALKPCPCHGDTKHLKAGIKDNCDKSTCAKFWEQLIGNRLHKSPHKDAATGNENFRPIPSVQKDVLFRGQKQEQIPTQNANKNLNQNGTKDQFKITIENENGQSNNQFTELTKTKSGELAIELDEQMIELIERKSMEEPYLYVSLKKTDSGHIIVDFDSKKNVTATQRVKVRRSSSGTRLLDVNQDLISLLKDTISNERRDTGMSKSRTLSSSATTKDSPNQVEKVENSLLIDNTDNKEGNIEMPYPDRRLSSIGNKEETVGIPQHPGRHSLSVGSKEENNENAQHPGQRLSPTDNKVENTEIHQHPSRRSSLENKEENIEKLQHPSRRSSSIGNKEDTIKTPQHPTRRLSSIGSKEDSTETPQHPSRRSSLVRNKEENIEISQHPSRRSSSNSNKEIPHHFQRIPSWKSGVAIIKEVDKDCVCPPDPLVKLQNKQKEEMQCTCPPIDSIECTCESSRRPKVMEYECDCPLGPPISYKWEPGILIKDEFLPPKEEYDCDCSPQCKPVSTRGKDLPLKVLKIECDCPQDSQTSYSWQSATSKSLESIDECDYVSELKELYKHGNANVTVKIRGKSGSIRKLDTVVTRTPSDSIAIYGRNISSQEDIIFDGKEYPVLFSKSVSGTYFIGFGQYDHTLNAVLRKTPSGGMLLVPKLKSVQGPSRLKPGCEEFFKVKVTGVRNYPVELPAVLKTTPSDNYIIVLDKEFEKRYRQTVNEYIGDRSECIVDLNRTVSGNFTIELDFDDDSHLIKRNALLVKSSSGNVKVLVRGPEFESIVQSVSKKSSSSSAKAFRQLIKKLPASSREIHRENLRKSKFLEKKASSDTQLYEKVRVKLQDNNRLLSEPSAVLKKTDSGQYSIILNKESKKAFINNLQSYLTTSSQGLVPIKRTESGEIIIILNNNDENKGRYGSLKITSSGNIYVIVDQKTIKDITKDSRRKDESSIPVARKSKEVKVPTPKSVNKSIATTCNARPDDHFCDKSKCVCEEFQLEAMDWFQDNLNKHHCGVGKRSSTRDQSPHIVIKPCDGGPPTKKKYGSEEQCYYLLDTVCPYHKNRYDTVSNELLEISGCNKVHANLEMNKIEFEANTGLPNDKKSYEVFDYTNYLPPQLPPFLRNISF